MRTETITLHHSFSTRIFLPRTKEPGTLVSTEWLRRFAGNEPLPPAGESDLSRCGRAGSRPSVRPEKIRHAR